MLAPASPRALTAAERGRQCVTASLTGSGRPLRPCAWRTGANLSLSSGPRPPVKYGAATTAVSIGLRCSAVWHRSPRAITTPPLSRPKQRLATAFYCRPNAPVGAAHISPTSVEMLYPGGLLDGL